MTEIIKAENADWKSLGRRVRSGEVFIYPTDTVYGLGCNAMDEDAVGRIFRIKGREGNKPLSVAFHSIEQLLEYVKTDEAQREIIAEKLPGPYSFIVYNKLIPRAVTAGLDTVGVRVPDSGICRRIIREAGLPIISTSVNYSGETPACGLHEIPCKIIDSVDFLVDAGEAGSGKPSTIINLLNNKILR